MEDIQLINRIITGDTNAEKILFDRYNIIVYNRIKSKFGIYKDIDDDVIEIISKVFMNLYKFDNTISSFKSWVFSITRNHLIDKWRKYENNVIFCDYNKANNVFDYNDEYNIIESNDYLEFISKNMNKSDYDLLEMKYFKGYKLCEIGEHLSQDVSYVNNKINRIKRKLQKTLI